MTGSASTSIFSPLTAFSPDTPDTPDTPDVDADGSADGSVDGSTDCLAVFDVSAVGLTGVSASALVSVQKYKTKLTSFSYNIKHRSIISIHRQTDKLYVYRSMSVREGRGAGVDDRL